MLILGLCLVTATVQADEIPDFPPHVNGCFTLEDTKTLILIHNRAVQYLSEKELLEKKLNLQLQSLDHLEFIIEIQNDMLVKIKLDRDNWFEQWKVENKKRHIAENRPQFGSWLAWGTVGVFIVSTSLLVGVVVGQR